MSIVRTLTLLGLFLLAGGPIPNAHAQAQVSCEWYARTALDQQRRNLERGCGFEGVSWSSDRARHLAWCKSTAPDDWKRQAQFREQQLSKCPGR